MTPDATVRAYHQRTKHHLDRYAAGPGTLDWDAQPDPFRTWSDTTRIALPRDVALPTISWSELGAARAPAPLTLVNVSTLLRLSVAISAWKQYGDARWSLRVHPSSGNLHPTETYVLAVGVAGLADGLYHYQARDHSLELRADQGFSCLPGLWLGFASITWREAWKYGERAFRYCQLDLGHVLGAVSYAAALLGWRPQLRNLDSETVAARLGLDRSADFAAVEAEEGECLLAFSESEPPHFSQWHGRPGLLDAKPLHSWPVIDEVAMATRSGLPHAPAIAWPIKAAVALHSNDIEARRVLLKRRSAQAFDGRSTMPRAVFDNLLAAMLPGTTASAWPFTVQVMLMVHRVEGLAAGLYCLARSDAGLLGLQGHLRDSFEWTREDALLPLYRLIAACPGKVARAVSCHQDIADQGAFTCVLLAEFDAALAAGPVAYRHMHWQAGLIAHALTLAAEAEGWRGTGIGCFFDDAVHEVLGITDTTWQVIYHYAVGMPVDDLRLLTLPAYT